MAATKEAELETMPKEEDEGHLFVVRQSHVASGGTVRVNETVSSELGLAPNAMVEVVFGRKSVAVHLYADGQVEPGQIVLRPEDMHRLGVSEGDQVRMKSYTTAYAATRESFRNVGRRIERRLGRTKPKEEGGT